MKRVGVDIAEAGRELLRDASSWSLGLFSIGAGVLLIFMIFVMLAAERKPEMGMARAVGTQARRPRPDVPLGGHGLQRARGAGRDRPRRARGVRHQPGHGALFREFDIEHLAPRDASRSLVDLLLARRGADLPDRDLLVLAGQPDQHRPGDPRHPGAAAADADVARPRLLPDAPADSSSGPRPRGWRRAAHARAAFPVWRPSYAWHRARSSPCDRPVSVRRLGRRCWRRSQALLGVLVRPLPHRLSVHDLPARPVLLVVGLADARHLRSPPTRASAFVLLFGLSLLPLGLALIAAVASAPTSA